jgi:rod shape-determining protein MreC
MAHRRTPYVRVSDWILLAVLMVLSLGLLLGGPAGRIGAARLLWSSLLAPFRLLVITPDPLAEQAELARLRDALTRERLSKVAVRELRQENERLRGLLAFAEQEPRALVPASVVARSTDRFGETLLLGAGARGGVARGQTVLGLGGLVGVVTVAGEEESWVQTLRHDGLAVSGMLQSTRQVGLLRWDPARRALEFEGLRLECRVAAGDTVITSGLGQVFPKGLPIGRVSTVADDSLHLVKRVHVQPFVDFDRLEELLLLRAGDAAAS